MDKKLAVGLLAAGVLLAGGAWYFQGGSGSSGGQAAPFGESYKTYRNEEYGFEFQYPAELNAGAFAGDDTYVADLYVEIGDLRYALRNPEDMKIGQTARSVLSKAVIEIFPKGAAPDAYLWPPPEENDPEARQVKVGNDIREGYVLRQTVVGPLFNLKFSRGEYDFYVSGFDPVLIEQVLGTFRYLD
jgi:hypothetical protein